MGFGKRNIERIERLLFSSWKSAEAVPGKGWQENLMKDIRAETGQDNSGNEIFSSVAWRVAIAAGIAAFILLTHSFYSGIIPEMDLSTLFVLDPAGVLISPPFGLA